MRTTIFVLSWTLLGMAAVCGQEPSNRASSQETKHAESGETVDVPKVTVEQPMNFWMAKKLDYSKSILEALTMGDFDRLAIDAERLRVLGKLEGFVRSRNSDYRLQMTKFDLASSELVSSAKKKRADGASLAFNHLTNSCVSCHQLLREGVE